MSDCNDPSCIEFGLRGHLHSVAELAEEVGARCGHNDQTLDSIHGTLTCTACGAVSPDPFHHNPGGG